MREPANQNIKMDIEERLTRDLVRQLREGSASLGACWDSVDLAGLEHRPYRRDHLAPAVHPDHPLAGRKSLKFEQTLDHEHIGLHSSSAVHTMLQRAAARADRTVSCRVMASNFDSAFRVVAANPGISVIPVEVGGPIASRLGIKLIPLTDTWAQRNFAVYFQNFDTLQPASQRMVQHLIESAAPAKMAN